MAVPPTVVEIAPVVWANRFNGLFTQVMAPFFGRREPRLRARSYMLGLLSGLERKNGWSLAEFAGDTAPDGMQRLLNHARWDADEVRDALRAQTAERLGCPAGVLVVDDPGFEQKGRRSAGVQRQSPPAATRPGGTPGTAGKITNCQIGVFRSYVNPDKQRVLIDRELYLPEPWFAEADRLGDAGVPDGTRFATKPELAWRMIERCADDPLLSFAWVGLRRQHPPAGALSKPGMESCIRGLLRPPGHAGRGQGGTPAAFAALNTDAWQRYSCGPGAKGQRFYDWAWIHLAEHEWVLARRSISDPAEVAFYRCWAMRTVSLPELVQVAGSRWSVEEVFQATKNEAGLDHYQVRKHTAWYRHITLAMVVHAHLAFLAADPPIERGGAIGGEREGLATQGGLGPQEQSPHEGLSGHGPGELIELTVNEIRRLHAHYYRPDHLWRHRIRWSRWRRRHQARARRCHYQRQKRLIDH